MTGVMLVALLWLALLTLVAIGLLAKLDHLAAQLALLQTRVDPPAPGPAPRDHSVRPWPPPERHIH